MSFVFEIQSISPDYSFSSQLTQFDPGPYSESVTFALKATCIAPDKLAGTEIDGWILSKPRQVMFKERARTGFELYVGNLEIGKRRNSLTVFLPSEAVWGVLASVGTGMANYMVLRGPSLFRASSLISSIHFSKEIDLEEW